MAGTLPWPLIAAALWAVLALGVSLCVIAVLESSPYRGFRLGIAGLALLTPVSWIGLFSVGPFVIGIPVLTTALVLTKSAKAITRSAAVALAALIYVLPTWIWEPAQRYSLLVLPAACLAAYALAALIGRERRPTV